jgi:hypothetical protein
VARLSVRRVLLISAVFALVAVSLGALALLPAARDRELRQAEAFAREVERRFEAGDGLVACDSLYFREQDEIPRTAQRALSALGEPIADITLVIAPTYGEVSIFQIDRRFVRYWTLPGRTGWYSAFPSSPRRDAGPSPENDIPEAPGWFTVTPRGGPRRELPPFEGDVLLAPLIRHIRFPSGAQRRARHGVGYYFLAGTGECAQTMSPEPGGQSQRLLDLINAMASEDFEEAHALARQIDLADGAPPTWRERLDALFADDHEEAP